MLGSYFMINEQVEWFILSINALWVLINVVVRV